MRSAAAIRFGALIGRVIPILIGGSVAVFLVAVTMTPTTAEATIHPIVESFDCANDMAFANHPLGDPADPPGQTPAGFSGHPGAQNHSPSSDLRGVFAADANAVAASFDGVFGLEGNSPHKMNEECGTPQNP